jgi:hypothetical protein
MREARRRKNKAKQYLRRRPLHRVFTVYSVPGRPLAQCGPRKLPLAEFIVPPAGRPIDGRTANFVRIWPRYAARSAWRSWRTARPMQKVLSAPDRGSPARFYYPHEGVLMHCFPYQAGHDGPPGFLSPWFLFGTSSGADRWHCQGPPPSAAQQQPGQHDHEPEHGDPRNEHGE